MSYSGDPESYWDERIKDKDRYSSVGIQNLPNNINKARRGQTFETLEHAFKNNSISLEESQVLDAGCGTGIYSEFYARNGADVFGVDLSQKGINEIEELDIPGTYLQSDLTTLPFEDRKFDLVHCFSVLYHIVDESAWQASLEELDRVTMTGGYLLLRIGWVDEEQRPSEHVRIRNKSKYIRELCEKKSYTIEGVYPLLDQLQYEGVFTMLNQCLPSFASEACSPIAKKLNLFEEHSEQKLVVLQKSDRFSDR